MECIACGKEFDSKYEPFCMDCLHTCDSEELKMALQVFYAHKDNCLPAEDTRSVLTLKVKDIAEKIRTGKVITEEKVESYISILEKTSILHGYRDELTLQKLEGLKIALLTKRIDKIRQNKKDNTVEECVNLLPGMLNLKKLAKKYEKDSKISNGLKQQESYLKR